MHMYIVAAIYEKQFKDLFKNVAFLLLFFLYPILTFIIVNAMGSQDASPAQFVAMFATMHTVFTPIVVGSCMVGEEKQKRTLRELMLANVTTFEYMFSVASFLFLFTLLSGSLFLVIGSIHGVNAVRIISSIAVGGLLSTIVGMSIGLIAKNETSVTALSIPAALLISFGPMLANFNQSIYRVTRFIYGQYINDWIYGVRKVNLFAIIIMIVNAIIIMLVFGYAYHKNKTDY